MAVAHMLLMEHVVLLPECQFWMLRLSPRSPIFAQGTAVAPFYGYFTCYSHNEEGELGRAGAVASHTPHASVVIFRLLCSAGFKCHL